MLIFIKYIYINRIYFGHNYSVYLHLEQIYKCLNKLKKSKTLNSELDGTNTQDLENINNPNINTYSISFVPEVRSGSMLPRYSWFNQ